MLNNTNSPLVTVVIPSYNRIKFLEQALQSVFRQTLEDYEVVVINDGSSDSDYFNHDYIDKIHQINLETNQKNLHGFGPGAIRNFGNIKSNTKYIAFLDDDDVWLPEKLQVQISIMTKENLEMTAHQIYLGNGIYDESKKYRLGNDEIYLGIIRGYFKNNNSKLLEIENGMPEKITIAHQKIHNLLITSSTIMTKELIDKVGKFNMKQRNEDHEYWNRALEIIPYCLYIKNPLSYYDNNHGDGRLY